MALFSADIGKRIKRVVQKADQNLGRAEKSEVLTDEILAMEKLIDLIRQSFQATLKRLQACLPPAADPEKRLRKLPESALSMTLTESAGQLTQSPVFSKAFGRFGEAEQSLADALIQFTVEIEKSVLQPLVTVVDKDIPVIQKLRRQLTKMVLDMDSAKKALGAALNKGQVPPGKVDSAREELEAEEVKVEQCRDQLLTEMYQFFSHEERLCGLLLSSLQLQASYHRTALASLERQIAQMSDEIDQNSVKPVYGCDLAEHLLNVGQEIATVIDACAQSIQRLGPDAEGLFRIAPATSKLRKLTAAFDANIIDVDGEDADVHCLAGALKLYLRELPNPLMTFELFDDWSDAVQRDGSEKLEALLAVVKKLPKANYDNLRYLIRFLSNITKHSDVNKMSSTNLAIVIAPNLLYPSKDDQGSMQVTGVALSAVEPLISQCDWFFPNDNNPGSQSASPSSHIHDSKTNVAHEFNSKHSPNNRKKASGPKPKKTFAPAPPVGRQRSESVPNFCDARNTTEVTTTTEDVALNSEKKPKHVDKLSPAPKTAVKPGGAKDGGDAENIWINGDFSGTANVDSATGEETIGRRVNKEGSLSPQSRFRRWEAIDGNSFDEETERQSDDESSGGRDVFSPANLSPRSNAESRPNPAPRSPPAPQSKHSHTGRSTEPAQTAAPSAAHALVPGSSSHDAAAPSVIDPVKVDDDSQKHVTKETGKASPVGHVGNKSWGAATLSSSSPLFNFPRSQNFDVKYATLPNDASFSQCRIKPRDDTDDDDSRPRCATEVTGVKPKPRPKVPARSPARDKNHPTVADEIPKHTQFEDTHL